MKKNINKLVFAGLLTFLTVISCDKKLNVLDRNSPTQESYFKTAAELQNGINAIYSSLRGGSLVGREWFFVHDMRGGETNSGGAQLEQPRAELLNQPSPTPSNSVMTSVWQGSYQMINRANLILSKASSVTDNASLKDRVIGEAKFLRAWAYFELTSQWGDVPLYTEPVASSTGYKGKSAAADIYTLIISDLTDAAAKLPASYGASDLGRATLRENLRKLRRFSRQRRKHPCRRWPRPCRANARNALPARGTGVRHEIGIGRRSPKAVP